MPDDHRMSAQKTADKLALIKTENRRIAELKRRKEQMSLQDLLNYASYAAVAMMFIEIPVFTVLHAFLKVKTLPSLLCAVILLLLPQRKMPIICLIIFITLNCILDYVFLDYFKISLL